jgi:CysZ protein
MTEPQISASNDVVPGIGEAPAGVLFAKGVGRRVRFLEAAGYPFKAFGYIAKNPSLWLWLLLPVLINVIVGYYAWRFTGGWVSEWLQQFIVAGGPLQDWLQAFSKVLTFVVQFGASVFAMLVIGNLLVIPFNEWLSEKVDRNLGWQPCPTSLTYSSTASHLWLVTRYELSRMSIYVSIMVPLMLLSLVPAVAMFTVPMKFLVTIVFLAMDNFSYSLDRRGHIGIGCKFRFLFSRFMPALGFGFGMTLFLMIPLINFVFLPVGAIGATMLYWHMNPEGDHRPRIAETN